MLKPDTAEGMKAHYKVLYLQGKIREIIETYYYQKDRETTIRDVLIKLFPNYKNIMVSVLDTGYLEIIIINSGIFERMTVTQIGRDLEFITDGYSNIIQTNL